MSERLERALQRRVIGTNRSPLRHLWAVLYAAFARGTAVWLGRGTASTVYLTGSLANGEPVYGLSDIDLVVVVPDRSLRPEIERRLESMHALLPLLSRLVAHVWVYDERELQAAASGSYPSFAANEGAAAYTGERGLPDAMGLLDRPGLVSPAEGWRRLRGHGVAPGPVRDRQDERLAAWLEIQYRLRWALPALARGGSPTQLAGALAGIARVWLWLVHSEPTAGNRSALWQSADRLPDEREVLWLAAHLIEGGEADAASAPALWAALTRLVAGVAEQIELELAGSPATEVRLFGTLGGDKLPLLDWCGLALPRVEWPRDGLPTCEPPRFRLADGELSDPATIARTLTAEPWTMWDTLRDGPLLMRPTRAVWDHGRLRTAELPASDPVSFALLDNRDVARFPDARGWSALDRARRAVAEHRAWLFASGESHAAGPEWVGDRPAANWDTPATRSLLLSAARAGLFLDSIEAGEPLLPLDHEATVDAWNRRDPFAGEVAATTVRELGEPSGEPPYEDLVALVDSVHRMPAYQAPGRRRPVPPAARAAGRSMNGHHRAEPVRLASFPYRDKNPYMRLLYGALTRFGIDAVGEGRLDPLWLWRQREAITFLHFHWDKYYSETTDEDGRWRELRSWLKLMNFGTLLLISRGLGYRIVWTVHEVLPHEPRSRRRDLLAARLLSRTSHAVMAHDDATRRRAETWLDMQGREMTVVPHGSYVGVYPPGRSRAEVRHDWGLEERQFVFLAFGNLRRYKRLELLLDAFAMCDEPDAALVISGEFLWRFRQPEWEQRMIHRLEEAARGDARIRYRIGRVPDHMVAELHAACDVAVMARSDGWTSGSMILALSQGLPVVAAREPAYEELVGGNAAGWLYETGDASSLASALTAAVRERDQVPARGREARRRAEELSWDAVAAGTASVLRSTLPPS